MTLLDILQFPDPSLRKKAKPVTEFNADLKTLVSDMLETMYEAPGIGLAATQVDVHKCVLVTDISEEKDSPQVLINPEILETEGTEESDEGCLSVPGYYEPVRRAQKIRVRAQDENGEPFEFEADGLKAVCVQHEMDHLNGKLFVDYISTLKRDRIRKKLEKLKKQESKS